MWSGLLIVHVKYCICFKLKAADNRTMHRYFWAQFMLHWCVWMAGFFDAVSVYNIFTLDLAKW